MVYLKKYTGSLTCVGLNATTGDVSGANLYAVTAIQSPTITGTNVYANTLVQGATVAGATLSGATNVFGGTVSGLNIYSTNGIYAGTVVSGANVYATTAINSPTIVASTLSGGTIYSTGAIYAGATAYSSGNQVNGNLTAVDISGTNLYGSTLAQAPSIVGTTSLSGANVFATTHLTAGSTVRIVDTTTYLSKDGSNNLVFTDAVTGSKTLAQLGGGGTHTTYYTQPFFAGAVIGSGTKYLGPLSTSVFISEESAGYFAAPEACTVNAIYARAGSPPAGSEACSFYIMKNNAQQTMVATMYSGVNTAYTSGNPVSLAVGDLMNIQLVNTGASVCANVSIGLRIASTSA